MSVRDAVRQIVMTKLIDVELTGNVRYDILHKIDRVRDWCVICFLRYTPQGTERIAL